MFNWSDHYSDEFYSQFRDYPARSKMFEFFAIDGLEKDGHEWLKIGHIENLTNAIESRFGDASLFFVHQKFELEVEKRPHWLDLIKEEDNTLLDDDDVF